MKVAYRQPAALGLFMRCGAQPSDARHEATLARQQLETRVRAVEINQAGQTSDLRAIQVGISEIKAAISKIGDAP